MVRSESKKVPALKLPGGRILRYHPATRHATLDVLDNLIVGSRLGEDIAKGINRMLEAGMNGAPIKGDAGAVSRRDQDYIVELDDSDWTLWQDYYRKMVGHWGREKVTTKDAMGKNVTEWETVFKAPTPQERSEFARNISALANITNLLRKTFGILLDTSDPNAEIIEIIDCIDGNEVFGFRLSGGGGEAQRILGKCILRLWTTLGIDQGYERNTLNTLLILDECVTLIGDDEDFAKDFLAKGRSMGMGAVLAFQNLTQWLKNLATLGSLIDNCGTFIRLLPFSPREAADLVREQLPKDEVESIQVSDSQGIVNVEEGQFARTSFGRSAVLRIREHYTVQYLSQEQHKALFTGYYNRRRYADRLLGVEKKFVKELAEEESAKGRELFIAMSDADHPDWAIEDSEIGESFSWGDPELDDYSWADATDYEHQSDASSGPEGYDEPTTDYEEFDAWAAQGGGTGGDH
jgi:hypothetical protein